jgi:hypothetical protein
MPLQTKGFLNVRQKERHFTLHGDDFGASNAEDYELQADIFLGGAAPEGCQEGIRRCGDRIRYDPSTEFYGVLGASGVIRTFFKPVPCVTIGASHERDLMRRIGKCHGFANNLLYFQSECAK